MKKIRYDLKVRFQQTFQSDREHLYAFLLNKLL